MKDYYENILIVFETLPEELRKRNLIDNSFKNSMKKDIKDEVLSQLLDYLFYTLNVTIYFTGKLKSTSRINVKLPTTQNIDLLNKKQSYKSIW